MELSEQQLKAVKDGNALRFSALESEFVVLRADLFDRIQSLLSEDDLDPDAMYPLLAEISPEDWEDPSVYGITRNQQ